MAKSLKPITCDRILERYAALGCTEVALSRHDKFSDMIGVELITVADDGSVSRDWISGLFPKKKRSQVASRLMDFHSGVVHAQRALGMSDRRAA